MDWIALSRELSEEFGARAGEVDRVGCFPTENIERLKQTGYLAMPVPEELGGGGADLETVCRAQGIIARGCASTALATNMHLFGLGSAAEGYRQGDDGAALLLGLAASGVVIGGSFTDAATGLNVRYSSTPARPVEGGYIVSGRKSFCSLAPVLDFFWGTAGVVDGGPLILFGLPRDTPGLTFVDSWDVMAMRGTGSWDVVFEDVFVPEAAAQRSEPNQQWEGPNERAFAWFALTVASVYLGVARAAADFAYGYTTGRTVTGASLAMSRQPGAIFNAAEIEILLRPAEALVAQAIGRRQAGESLTSDEISTIKYVAVNNAAHAVDRCFRMVGGHGLFRKLPLERYFRDARAGQFHPPSNDGALETIGKAVLGISPEAEPRWPPD